MSVNSTVASTRSLTTGRRTPVRNCWISSATASSAPSQNGPSPGARRSARPGCARRRSASGARRGTCRARGRSTSVGHCTLGSTSRTSVSPIIASAAAAAAGLIARRWMRASSAPQPVVVAGDKRRHRVARASRCPSDSTIASTIAARSSTLGAHSYPGPRDEAGLRRHQDERPHEVRMGGREQRRQAAALGDRDQHRLLGADARRSPPGRRRSAPPAASPRRSPSDIPLPRRSNRISRENDASRSRKRAQDGSSQTISMFDMYDGTSTTSSGPSPTTW